MKALSIRQPWAWAILYAGKDIENRSWKHPYRGPVAIHAAKGMTRNEWAEGYDVLRAIRGRATPFVSPQDLKRGGIVGVAEIIDCVDQSDSPWFFGRYGFVLAKARPVPFIPLRGQLGFFPLPAEVEAQLQTVIGG